jgi:hypothetical protein
MRRVIGLTMLTLNSKPQSNKYGSFHYTRIENLATKSARASSRLRNGGEVGEGI